MTHISRRTALIGATASLSLAACGNGIGSNGPATIDARTASTMNFMVLATSREHAIWQVSQQASL